MSTSTSTSTPPVPREGGGWRTAGAVLAAALTVYWAMRAKGAVHALTGGAEPLEPDPGSDEQIGADEEGTEDWSGSCNGDGAVSWSALGVATAALPVMQFMIEAARVWRKAG